jgi:hypothetical protein
VTQPARMEELRKIFLDMDKDQSGCISITEFKEAMAAVPDVPQAQVRYPPCTPSPTSSGIYPPSESPLRYPLYTLPLFGISRPWRLRPRCPRRRGAHDPPPPPTSPHAAKDQPPLIAPSKATLTRPTHPPTHPSQVVRICQAMDLNPSSSPTPPPPLTP